jgi:NAD+ kinase
MKNKMREIGIYLNMEKEDSLGLSQKCIAFLLDQGMEIALLEGQILYQDKAVHYYPKEMFFKNPDCILVLGGDGTLLFVARQCCFSEIPIFGINLGKLGFLTEGEASHYKDTLTNLVKGSYYIEKRMMLNCMIKRKNKQLKEFVALNDVLVRSRGFRMMDIRAYANGTRIDTIRADGLIISTPTGSTGYSLAAGGPIVAPGSKAIILNPICPHRLHDRSYVLPIDDVISLEFGEREKKIAVTIDGQTIISIHPEDEVTIKKSSYFTQLIRLNKMSYFDRLRVKLSNEIL